MLFLVKSSLLTSLLALLSAIAFVLYDDYTSESDFKRLEKWSDDNIIVIDKSKSQPKAFKVEFDQKEWNLLKAKLELARYFEPLSDKYVRRNEFGFDPEYAKELVDYWKTKFNWTKQVETLNRFPQFRVQFDDITIHYVHFITNLSAKVKKTVLLMDGWPGSFFGFYKMIDYMNENYKDVSFDIIVPSIPGYGFSTPLNRPFDYVDASQYYDALMRLVHGENVQYFIHGTF
jgi:hypothetical protein